LTKTHCVGHCEVCRPDEYTDTAVFQRECMSITHLDPNRRTGRPQKVVRIPYSQRPAKAVHLFRNPFDNLVARMHMGVERRREKLNWTEVELSRFATYDVPGFQAWCSYLDSSTVFKGGNVRELLQQRGISLKILDGLPCLSEWWRYVQWHNNAVSMLQQLQIPKLVLYYEDYSSQYQQTVRRLLDFLELDQVQPALPFVQHKTYKDYYDPEATLLAREFVQTMASPLCWEHLQRYFTIHDHQLRDDAKQPSSAVTSTSKNGPPVVALLLSFPNSVSESVDLEASST
jgi:hypothetical protein